MTLLSDKLSLIGLLVILLEVALIVLVVSPEQARRARVAEQETATAVFGAPLAARALIVSSATPKSARTDSVSQPGYAYVGRNPPGVRLRRGAGSNCGTEPSTGTKLPRATLCGCCSASANESTGA